VPPMATESGVHRTVTRNLRILDVSEIKTVPYAPLSHPCVERLIGTIRRECLDRTLFWTTADLEMKLLDFQRYYNGSTRACRAGRTHARPERRPGPRTRDAHFVSLAGALSWAVSNTDRGMTDAPADGRLFESRALSNVYLPFSALRGVKPVRRRGL